MTDVRIKSEALRDECERLARKAESEAGSPDLTEDQRRAASERAKVYWQMSRSHADTVTASADARLAKYNRPNTGQQAKTRARVEFLWRVIKESGHTKRQLRARAAIEHPDCGRFFEAEDADKEDAYKKVYRFLGRDEFCRDEF